MKTYISLLRGINVSGHKKIAIADLKALYETLGFTNLVTYIQSGNVIFTAKVTKNLEQIIEQAITKKYAFDVPVLIITPEELSRVIAKNPFLKDKTVDPEKLHVTFLSTKPVQELLDKLAPAHYLPDRFNIIGSTVYLSCPNGYGQTKLTNTFFENKLKVRATTRNWKTVKKLLEIAQFTH